MICPKCQHRNSSDAAFCDECATPLQGTCPSCLASNRRSAKFCRLCGYPILDAVPVPVPTRPSAALLAERLDGAPSYPTEVEGERKQLTVLFADIKGSMELIAFRDPEDARRILDPVVSTMISAVYSFGGTVNRVAGDGIMALFGAPIAQEDHALRACRAAVRIQELISGLVGASQFETDVDIKVRVGLNTGEVVFHLIQAERQVDYSVTGHAVHLAARMEQLAQPGKILITELTLRACAGMLDVTSLGSVPVKGLATPQRVYELNRVRSQQTRLAIAGQAGTLSRFVGRETESARLDGAAAQTREGKGQVVALVGEPGIGKSRLAYEFANALSAEGFSRLEVRALSYGTRSAFMPVVALLRSYMGVHRGNQSTLITERVMQKIRERGEGLEEALPPLLWLLGVGGHSEEWDDLDPQIKRERALDALKRLMLAESRMQPLLLLFEDLQWLDAESHAMLETLIDAITDAPVLLVLTYRDEFMHQWADRPHYTKIDIEPLQQRSTQELLEALLGPDASLAPLKGALAAKTGGNPFFVEESVRSLIESGTIVGEEEIYRIAKPVTELEIAPSVQTVLAARIDRLTPQDKRLLQAASVVGQDVPVEVLREVVGLEVAQLDAGLTRLRLANFLDQSKLVPPTYAFKHALTHEVAYASQLRERRKVIHAKTLRAVEHLSEGHVAEYLETLAHHALRAESWEKAVHYPRQAGSAAAVRSAFKEAEDWYRSALGALAHWPEGREKSEVGFDLRLDLYAAVLTRGDIAPVFEVLEQAEAIATAIADEGRLSLVAGRLSQAYWWIADYNKALELGQRALALAHASGRRGVELRAALMTLAWSESALGSFEAAKQHLRALLEVPQAVPGRSLVKVGLPSSRVMALSWVTLCCADTGEFAEGLEAAREAVRIAEELDQPWSKVAAYYALGSILSKCGKLGEAITVLEQGQLLCADYVIPGWETTITWILGYAYALNGEPARGAAVLEQVVRESNDTRCYTRLSLRVANLAEAELLAGNEDKASELARHALQLAENYGEQPAEGQVRRLLGDIALLASGDGTVAANCYEQALTIAQRYSMRPLEAECTGRLADLRLKVAATRR